jgi:hypothetical protein
MDLPTLVLTVGFNGYLAWLVLWAARDVVGLGPVMVCGLIAGLGGLLIGEFAVVRQVPMSDGTIAAISASSVALIGYALWRHRCRDTRQPDPRDATPAPRE